LRKQLNEMKLCAETCEDLLKEFTSLSQTRVPIKLMFSGIGKRDVYNITAPFIYDGEEVLVGRVEERHSEFSQVFFFTRDDEIWSPRNHTPTYNLQDPAICSINEQLVFSGVEVITDPDHPDKIISWVTQFYRGKHIDSLRHFASGPGTMKDIRLVELKDGRVGVFTRPQGNEAGRGQIGFTVIPSIDELNDETFLRAHILRDQFVKEEWGGANEAHLLTNGNVGILGHIASMDEAGNKHYYSMVFMLNPLTLEKSPIKIIAARRDFPVGPGKRPGLEDIVFSGGLIRLADNQAMLSVGVSDTEAYQILIPDPFAEYEL
jgi:hypothetical protein